MKTVVRNFTILGFAFLTTLTNCYTPSSDPASVSRGHSLVKYNPPPEGDTRLKLAVKDNMDVKGEVTSAGSEYLAKHNPPAEKDAPCLARARADKNVFFIGRTNMTELAVAPSGVNEYYGTPRNRRSHTRKLIPGGSSSGAAVVVANGIADVAFGTDTAGSVRVPAACCGVFGLKTTFGLVPIKGIYPISDKYLDTVGPLAKDIPRLVKGMDLLEAGFVDKYQAAESSKPTGETIRVGRLYIPGTDSAIDKAVDEALELAKFKVVRLNDDFVKKWVRAQKEGNTVAAADAWQHDRDLASKSDVNIVTKAIIALGNLEYSLNYKGALKYRLEWQRTLRDLFKQVDFIALPTLKDRAPSLPFFGGSSALFEKKVLDMQNTVPANLAGNPAIAVPIHLERERGRITSLELVGPLLSEAGLVNAARIVEDAN